ncbi:TPA: hypothetical protein ACM246_002294, partial [Neisseria meningitidis]
SVPTGLDSRFCGNDAVGFLFFPIDSCCVAFLDSRFCGNDAVGVSVFADRFLWFFYGLNHS